MSLYKVMKLLGLHSLIPHLWQQFLLLSVRMLNKLKAENEDENVYLSSIGDEAVRFYYDFVFPK
jgi:hypothetical protein